MTEEDPLAGLIESYNNPVTRVGVELNKTLTGQETDPLAGLIERPNQEMTPQRELDIAKYTPTTRQLNDMLLQGAGLSLAASAGGEFAANQVPAHPFLAGLGGSFTGNFLGDMAIDAATRNQVRPGKSAVVAGAGLVPEALAGGLGIMGARGGGVSKRTVKGTLQEGPLKSVIRKLRGGPLTMGRTGEMVGGVGEAEPTNLARQTAEEATGALARRSLSSGRIQVNRAINQFDRQHRLYENLSPVDNQPLTQFQNLSEHPYSREGFGKIVEASPETPVIAEIPTNIIAQGREAVRREVIARALERGEGVPREIVHDFPDLLRQTEAGVDMVPVKNKIASLVDPTTTNDQVLGVNEKLKALLSRTPDQMSMRDFDKFIRQETAQVKQQLGNIEAGLPNHVKKAIAAYARNYRNTKVLPGAKGGYARASIYLNDVKSLRNKLVNSNGELKAGAENLWRTSLTNYRVREAMQRYDKATGDNLFERASRLARKQDWTPEDAKAATGGLDALAGLVGRGLVFLGRGGGKLAIGLSRPLGHVGAFGAREAFESAMNVGGGGQSVSTAIPYPPQEENQ